jgi:hypothetical protein
MEVEDDDLETTTGEDFGKAGELWYRSTGCKFGCIRSVAGGISLMVTCVTFALRCP